jgi:hypothetical protein
MAKSIFPRQARSSASPKKHQKTVKELNRETEKEQ